MAREALRDKLRPNDGSKSSITSLSVDTIQSIIAKNWNVTTEGLRSKTRTKALTAPRQVAMFFMRELLRMQLVEIGAAFGGRDHSTVIHSLERVSAMMNEEPHFAQRIGRLRMILETLAT